jgi:hypothetical protein
LQNLTLPSSELTEGINPNLQSTMSVIKTYGCAPYGAKRVADLE